MITRDNLRKLVTRNDLGTFLTEHGLTGVGVEVGTFEGRYAFEILHRWPGHLHVVDVWANQDEAVYCDGCNRLDMQACYEATINRLAEFSGRVTFHRALSMDVVDQFENHSLDFAYIDAGHDRKNFSQDFEKWGPKVKPNGIIGFHDVYDRIGDKEAICQVWEYMYEWMQKTGIRIHLTNDTSGWIVAE